MNSTLMNSMFPVFGGLLFSYGWTHFNKEYFYNPKDSSIVIAEKILKNMQSGVVAVLVQSSIMNESYFIQYEISLREEVTRILIWFLCLDLSFYLSHRAMHKYRWLYNRVHKEHHLAVNTYPIDAYILTPIETVFITLNILTGNILGLKTTERSHLTLMFFLLFHNILIHGSPSYTKKISFHNVHHKLQNYNFSGNTPLMDILFGTYK
mgnify:FL=1